MSDLIKCECQENRDPPVVQVTVAGVYIGEFPVEDYRRIRDVLGLPEVICPPE